MHRDQGQGFKDRYEVKFAGARKFTDGGRWCGTYKRSELQVIDRPKISDDKEEEFDVHKRWRPRPNRRSGPASRNQSRSRRNRRLVG